MQEILQKISPIKQRFLHFVDTLGISKRDFYAATGISRGTLESPTGITEDTIAKVFAIYPNLSPTWVVLGRGEMLNNQNLNENNCNLSCNLNCNQLVENDKKNAYPNAYPNAYLSPVSEESIFNASLVAEPVGEYHTNKDSNAIVKHLIEVLREQSEEIGALKQENTSLKSQLVKLADSAPNVSSVPA